MHPEMFEGNRKSFGRNLTNYYDKMRREDLFACYVVIAPQGARNPEMYGRKSTIAQGLQVTAETDDGIVLNGMKMLGTGAAFSGRDLGRQSAARCRRIQKGQSVTCAVPTGTEGVSLWVRQSYEKSRARRSTGPFSSRFDEIRRGGDLRQRQGAVGARVPARRRRAVARDVFPHAVAHHGQSSGDRALPREAQTDPRLRLPRRRDEQRDPGAGGARDVVEACGRGSGPQGLDRRPDRRRRERRPLSAYQSPRGSTPR